MECRKTDLYTEKGGKMVKKQLFEVDKSGKKPKVLV